MEYPLDKTGQASMRLRCARSTVDTAVQEKWVMEVRIVNFIDGEERSLKMERFIGSEG